MDVTRLASMVGLLFCACVAASQVHAQARSPMVLEETTRLISPDPNYVFGGTPLDLDGNRLVIGTQRFNPDALTYSYSAFVYERAANGSWTYVAKLLDVTDDYWNSARPNVAVEGNVIALTTYSATHVFERSSAGWTRTAVLTPPPGVTSTGSDLEIDGGTILVGGQSGNYQAIAYRKNSAGQWQLQSVMSAATGESDDEFSGGDVDISGATALVGSPMSAWTERDEVHVFSRQANGSWSLAQVLTAPTESPTPGMGIVVGVSGNEAIAAGLGSTGFPLFRRTGGSWQWSGSTLNVLDRQTVGSIISSQIRNGRVLAGFAWDRDRGDFTGSVNVFERPTASAGYEHVAKLLPSDAPGGWLGQFIAGSGRVVAASSINAVYIFDLPTAYSRPVRVLENFQDGVANQWTPQGIGSWSLPSSAGNIVYRQSSVLDGARSMFAGADWTNQAIEADLKASAFAGADRWLGAFVRYTDANNYYYVTLRSSNSIQLRSMVAGVFSTLVTAPLTVTPGRSYRVRLEAVGTWLRVYVDGRLLLQARDSSHTHGNAGVLMYKTSADVDNVIVSPSPSLTLAEANFEGGFAEYWTPSGDGQWTVPTDGTRVYRQNSVVGAARSVTGPKEARDQIVAADLKAVSFSGADRWFGLLARYVSPTEHYYVTLRSSNRVALRKLSGGTVTELDTAPFTVSPGTWYRVRFEAVGNQLRVYINDRLVLEADDASPLLSGQAGVAMYKASVAVDNVRVSQP